VFANSSPGFTQDDPRAIIDKAIKAHGGADKLARLKAVRSKAKGSLQLQGGLPYTQEVLVQLPSQIRDEVQVQRNPRTRIITVFDGSRGWVSENGRVTEMSDAMLGSMRNLTYLMNIGRLTPLKEKTYELKALPEVNVNNRPAVGVRVSSKGHRDVSLFFDRQTGLVAKVVFRTVFNQKEVNEERVVTAYQDVAGLKTARQVFIYHDGNKFLEAEVTDVQFPDKIDAGEFAKPQAK
jgi:hypothetical protein